MKLNGKTYFKKDSILHAIEELIIKLETGEYYRISEKIKDIKVENAENVAVKLSQFQDMFRSYFKHENYCNEETAKEMAEESMYDPKKEKVSLYSSGAYGIRMRADDDAVEKYVFNVCIRIFIVKLREFKRS